MSKSPIALEELEVNRFHQLLTLRAGGGWLLSGYVLSIIGVVLVDLSQHLALDQFWQGLLAAAAIIGICIGGFFGGMMSDRYGRKCMFVLAPLLLFIFSALQYFVQSAEMLFVCRLLVGIGVGIEYAVTSALMTECLPRRARGPRIALLVTLWFVGAACAYIIGHSLMAHLGQHAWHWVLASPAVLGLVLVLLRKNTLESPRWLMRQARVQDADQVIHQSYGSNYCHQNLADHTNQKSVGFAALLQQGYAVRVMFVSLFWACSVTPVFAVYAFSPTLLEALHLSQQLSVYGSIFITCLFVVGCALGIILINRLGRRRMLLHSFLWSLLALVGLAYFADAAAWLILLFFGAYAIFIGGAQILTIVYPNELFPTEIRAMAVGLCTSISKTGVVLGTWLVPIAIHQIGIANTMYIAAGINLIGLVVTYYYAIETSNLSLEQATTV